MAGLNSVGFSNSDNEIDLESLRSRLREMSDAELLRYGRAAKSMCAPDGYFGEAPRQTFVIQLAEARAELQRRKAEKERNPSGGSNGRNHQEGEPARGWNYCYREGRKGPIRSV